MLGGVLTAIVDARSTSAARRLRRVPAARAVPRRQRLRRARGRRHDRREPDARRRERLELVPRGDRGGRRPRDLVAGTGTYSTAHSVAPHRAGARARRRRFLVVTPYYNKPPQRGIVAHFEAIAARDRPADRRLQHPEPRRRQHRARDDLAARRDRERHGRQAGERDLDQARHIVDDRPRPLRGRRQPPAAVPRARRRRRHLRPHARRRAAGRRAGARRSATATSSGAREIDRELAPAYELLRVSDEPDPDQGGAESARPRRRRPTGSRSSRPTDEELGADPCVPRAARACSSAALARPAASTRHRAAAATLTSR